MNSQVVSELDFFDCPLADMKFHDKNIFERFMRDSMRMENVETCTNLIIIRRKGLCLVRERSMSFPLLNVVVPRHKEIGIKG